MAKLERFELGWKKGYKDENGNVIIEAIYDDGPSYIDKFAIVAKDKFCGVINERGETIIPFVYEEIYHLFDNLYAVRKGRIIGDWRFGVIDIHDDIIIPFNYKYITEEYEYIKCCRIASSEKMVLSRFESSGAVFEYKDLQDTEWFNSSGGILYKGIVLECKGNYLIIKEDGGLGVIDSQGTLIVPTKYEEIHCINEDRFVVRIKDSDSWRFGVIDRSGEIIIPFEYKYISSESKDFYECFRECECEDDYRNRDTACPYTYSYKNDVVWYNKDGAVICESHAYIISPNLLGVCVNDKWGVYNQAKQKIVNFLYDYVYCVQDKIVVVKDKKVGVLDENGRIIISPSYLTIECVSTNNKKYGDGVLFPKCYGQYSHKCVFDSNNEETKLLRKTISRHLINVSESSFDFNSFFILSSEEYSELYSIESGILADSQYVKIEPLTNLSFAVKKNNKWGVYRADESKLIIECIYDRIVFEGGHVILLQKDGLWSAKTLVLPDYPNFESLFNVDIPTKFKEIKILDESQLSFGVKKECKNYKDEIVEEYTIVDNKGDIFKKMSEFYELDKQCAIFESNYDRILTSKENKYGFISAEGYITIPFQYDDIRTRDDGRFDVKIGDAWGVIDISGKECAAIKYSHILPSNLSDAIVQNVFTERYGVLSEDGSEKILSIYEHIENKNGLFFFGYKGIDGGYDNGNFFSSISFAIWGVMDKNGKTLIPPKYDCFKFQDGFLLAGRNGMMLHHYDSERSGYGYDYKGEYDLYTLDGELIFGGFSERLWLFLDKDLKTILKNDNGKQVFFKKGAICNIEIQQEDNKKTYVFNMPIDVMAKGYSCIVDDYLIIYNSSGYAAVDIKSGEQTAYYSYIKSAGCSMFFFYDEDYVGIMNFGGIVKPAEYLFITNPVNGFFFAAKEIDDDNSCVILHSLFDNTLQITAIEKIKTDSLAWHTAKGELLIQIEGTSQKVENIILPKHEIFDDSFAKIVSAEESDYSCSLYDNVYWFSVDRRMEKEESHSSNYEDYDDTDYWRDSWYALTDGMYD